MDGGATQARQLQVLGIRDRYPFTFNSPRFSRHAIERRRFVPFDKFYAPLAGGTMVNPWPPRRFDLLHAWNRVPLGPTPFVIGFESHLPRSWGQEHTGAYRVLMDALLSPGCRRIVAISKAAELTFLHQHEANPRIEELRSKLIVRYPNVVIPEMQEWFDPAAKLDRLRILFVGGHFARKGGCVAVRLAEKARNAGLPIDVTVISSLTCGGGIWTDPLREEFFTPYLKLLDQPNVTLIRGAPNAKVLEIASQSHLSLLTTFGDTFGYSAFEGMMCYTPVIATAVSALPEFINDENGVLLPLETNRDREWRHSSHPGRDTPAFEKIFADIIEELAEGAFAACSALVDNPAKLASMRKAARRTAKENFDAVDANAFWDQLYLDAARAS